MSTFPERIADICVKEEVSLWNTMQSIQAGGYELALVIDQDYRLLGTVTDGDLRRAFLSGASFDEPIAQCMNRNFTYVTPSTGRAAVLDLMRARSLKQIPVLDNGNRLVGLHLLREMLGAVPRENWAIVMAGGRGERLRPLTDVIPKPMIKVAGRPILERIVLHLVGFGISRIFISVNYMAEMIEDYFGDGVGYGCHIEYLREERPLGTGGALSLLPELPTLPLLVLNGDLVTQFNVGEMLTFHVQGGFAATLAVNEYTHTVPYGVVSIEGDRVQSIQEKPTQLWLANAGIYIIEPCLLTRIPQETMFPLPTLIEGCLDQGETVGAFRLGDDWMDVGRHEELRKACGRE